jgi:hypothetical protein
MTGAARGKRVFDLRMVKPVEPAALEKLLAESKSDTA